MNSLRVALSCFLQILSWLILIKCIFSWIPDIRGTKVDKTLNNIVEPILSPVRNLMNRSSLFAGLPIDFSPVIVFLIIDVIASII